MRIFRLGYFEGIFIDAPSRRIEDEEGWRWDPFQNIPPPDSSSDGAESETIAPSQEGPEEEAPGIPVASNCPQCGGDHPETTICPNLIAAQYSSSTPTDGIYCSIKFGDSMDMVVRRAVAEPGRYGLLIGESQCDSCGIFSAPLDLLACSQCGPSLSFCNERFPVSVHNCKGHIAG